MHAEYDDIKSRIPEAPTWYDENGVPRYGDFTPYNLADIYADECVLLEIGCQGCDLTFNVAMSSSTPSRLTDVIGHGLDEKHFAFGELARRIRAGVLHYGDPPSHIETDHAGSTMNSEPRRVLEYWTRRVPGDWVREAELEIAIEDRR